MATKNKTPNPMANLVKTVTESTQGAKVTVTSTKSSLTNDELMTEVSDLSNALLALNTATNTVATKTEEISKACKKLHDGGFRVLDGRIKDGDKTAIEQSKLFKSLMTDILTAGGLTKATAQSYFEQSAKAINSGKPFVKNDKQTVQQMLKEKATTVKSFTLYVVGEGIEKKTDDFAAEVAAQVAAAKQAG